MIIVREITTTIILFDPVFFEIIEVDPFTALILSILNDV